MFGPRNTAFNLVHRLQDGLIGGQIVLDHQVPRRRKWSPFDSAQFLILALLCLSFSASPWLLTSNSGVASPAGRPKEDLLLTWADSSDNEEAYTVWRARFNGEEKWSLADSHHNFSLDRLLPSNQYSFKVRAAEENCLDVGPRWETGEDNSPSSTCSSNSTSSLPFSYVKKGIVVLAEPISPESARLLNTQESEYLMLLRVDGNDEELIPIIATPTNGSLPKLGDTITIAGFKTIGTLIFRPLIVANTTSSKKSKE